MDRHRSEGGGLMDFASDPIARRIREAASRGTLSHALLFSGSGDLASAARYAAAAMECQGGQKPCGVCPACRKVLRLPKIKGAHTVCCPCCGKKFQLKV